MRRLLLFIEGDDFSVVSWPYVNVQPWDVEFYASYVWVFVLVIKDVLADFFCVCFLWFCIGCTAGGVLAVLAVVFAVVGAESALAEAASPPPVVNGYTAEFVAQLVKGVEQAGVDLLPGLFSALFEGLP